MAIPDEFLYEYAVVRYVPRVDREEFVNIGLLMMCKRRKWLKAEIKLNSLRIKALDPLTDIDRLAEQASFFMRTDVPFSNLPVEERYRWLTAVKSAILQVSPSHPGLLPDSEGDPAMKLTEEFNRLLSELVP